MVTQHYFTVRGKYLLDDGEEAPRAFEGLRPGTSYTQGFAIHHYITKSQAQCVQKIMRGRPKPSNSKWKYRRMTYWTTYDRNEVEDFRAGEVIAPIQERVVQLRDEIDARITGATAAPGRVPAAR
jgi:hypothetical protein